MKKFVQAKAVLLLVIFCTYLTLSCSQEKDARTQAIEQTLSNIQERLKNKDYTTTRHLNNPYQNLKDKVKKTSGHMFKRLDKLKSKSSFKQISNIDLNNSFRLARVDESISFGIDDPTNLAQTIDEIYSYSNGAYTHDQISSMIGSVNDNLLNYPLNYSGADQLINDFVSNNGLTETTRTVIQSQLYAIINASSVAEVQSIINVITEEVQLSQLTTNEQNTILSINAATEGYIESNAIAYSGRMSEFGNEIRDHFQPTAEVAAVALVIIIGAIIGALTGFIVGGWLCQSNYQGASWDCMDEWVYAGAIIGAIAAIP